MAQPQVTGGGAQCGMGGWGGIEPASCRAGSSGHWHLASPLFSVSLSYPLNSSPHSLATSSKISLSSLLSSSYKPNTQLLSLAWLCPQEAISFTKLQSSAFLVFLLCSLSGGYLLVGTQYCSSNSSFFWKQWILEHQIDAFGLLCLDLFKKGER